MEYVNLQEYSFGYVQENIEVFIYSAVCFLVPFLIGHPQLVVGVLVNAALILASLNLKGWKLLPVVILPSIAVLSRGLIFGPFTVFLLYMIPFIWISNWILVWSFKKFNLGLKLNRWSVLGIGTSLKAGFLFGSAFLLVKFGVLPVLFLTTMGLLQVYTAVAGGLLAFGVQFGKRKINSV